MTETETQGLTQVWNDMIDADPEETAIDIARQQMLGGRAHLSERLELIRAFDLGVKAGITHKSWDDILCRPALGRIRTILDKYALEIQMGGVDIIDEIRKLITAGLDGHPGTKQARGETGAV